jgi:membrane fusion protein, multidrug efflux system
MATETTKPHRLGGWLLYLAGLAVLVAAGLILNRLLKSQKARVLAEVKTRTEVVTAGPRVQVYTVAPARPERTINLLGEAVPYQEVTLYAKVSGYLREIHVDKGDKVEVNQVVAVIESPETDQQYAAAVADAKNKRLNAERAQKLVKRDMIAQQDADQAETDAEVAEANVKALSTIKSYETLRAPFSGTVTARYADPGALLQNAANAQTSALPLVRVSQTDRLRVYVYPDQHDATFVHVGDRAEISMTERPGLKLAASVTRLSGELDSKTRTLLTEIDFDNRHGVIVPGSFVQVALRVRAPAYLEIPSNALVMRGAKPFVAVVTPAGTVTFRPIVPSGDDGQHVRVLSGLKAGERVALHLGESVAEGEKVQPADIQ